MGGYEKSAAHQEIFCFILKVTWKCVHNLIAVLLLAMRYFTESSNCPTRCLRKCQGIMKVSGLRSLRTMNVYTKFLGIPSDSFRNIFNCTMIKEWRKPANSHIWEAVFFFYMKWFITNENVIVSGLFGLFFCMWRTRHLSAPLGVQLFIRPNLSHSLLFPGHFLL